MNRFLDSYENKDKLKTFVSIEIKIIAVLWYIGTQLSNKQTKYVSYYIFNEIVGEKNVSYFYFCYFLN